jgi:hypothetical protein
MRGDESSCAFVCLASNLREQVIESREEYTCDVAAIVVHYRVCWPLDDRIDVHGTQTLTPLLVPENWHRHSTAV